MKNNNIMDGNILDTLSLLENKNISTEEIMEASLSQITKTNGKTKAYINREEAVHTTAGNLKTKPLLGIPISVKDNISCKNSVTTAGSLILKDWKPDKDAAVIQNLKNAGAIIIGKTNLDEFAWGSKTDNPHYGRVENPWNKEFVPGGSSGGSAVSVATRTCFASIGTDTGGSIRMPSSVNGMVGLRPTIGNINTDGVIPLAWTMDTVGPIAKTVEDCEIIYHVIRNGTFSKEALVSSAKPKLRVGILNNYFIDDCEPEIASAMKKVMKSFENDGIEFIEFNIEDIETDTIAKYVIMTCEASAFHQTWLHEKGVNYSADVKELLGYGEKHTAVHYIQAQRYRNILTTKVMDAFNQVDIILTPTQPNVGVPRKSKNINKDNWAESRRFTGLSSLTGCPAMTIPCGMSKVGIPIGMQLIAAPHNEEVLFQIGKYYQNMTDFHDNKPTFKNF